VKPTRVLVTGSAGQVGLDLLDTLAGATPLGGDGNYSPDGRPVEHDEFEVLGLTRHDLDITDRDAVMRAVEASRPDVIVNLAAYTAVDRAEAEREACLCGQFECGRVAVDGGQGGARAPDNDFDGLRL